MVDEGLCTLPTAATNSKQLTPITSLLVTKQPNGGIPDWLIQLRTGSLQTTKIAVAKPSFAAGWPLKRPADIMRLYCTIPNPSIYYSGSVTGSGLHVYGLCLVAGPTNSGDADGALDLVSHL